MNYKNINLGLRHIEGTNDKKMELIREKLMRDIERFFDEYSVQEVGDSGLLITTKL